MATSSACIAGSARLAALALALAAGGMLGWSSAPTENRDPVLPVCGVCPSLASAPSATAAWADATVILLSAEGQGSGAIISADGWILTNYHVVASDVQQAALTGVAAKLRVQLGSRTGERIRPSDEVFDGTVERVDPIHDLALIKINPTSDHAPLPYYELASEAHTGDEVFAIGSPGAAVPWTIKRGNIAAVTHFPEGNTRTVVGHARELSGWENPATPNDRINADVLATTALIAPGDSGGPLLNVRGELIGLNFACPSDPRSQMGYHIALDEVRAFVSNLPTEIERAPFDLWNLGQHGAITIAEPVHDAHDSMTEAVIGRVLMQTRDGVELVGRIAILDLSGGRPIESELVTPAGFWGLTPDAAAFVSTIVLAQRGDGLIAVGYADDSSRITEIRIDRDHDGQTDLIWSLGSDGRWGSAEPDDQTPVLDLDRLTDEQRERFEQLDKGAAGRAFSEARG